MQYLKVLQTIMKPKGALIRKCQDMVMSEVNISPSVLYSIHFCAWLALCLFYTLHIIVCLFIFIRVHIN